MIALAAASSFVWWLGFNLLLWLRIASNLGPTTVSVSFVLAIALAFFFISGKEIRKQPAGRKVICFAAAMIVSFLCAFAFLTLWMLFLFPS